MGRPTERCTLATRGGPADDRGGDHQSAAGRHAGPGDAATDILGRLAKARFADLPALLQYRAIALCNKGIGLLWSGHLGRADRYLWAALTASRGAGLVLVEINAVGTSRCWR